GEIVAVGPDVAGLAVGDRVLGGSSLPSGAYAELAVMSASSIFPAPEGLDDAEAAAFFISYQTGWFGLHRRARIAPGETLLVHAAAGGVGSAAVQLGKAAGARVIGVAGGEHKAAVARELGADGVIDRTTKDPQSRRDARDELLKLAAAGAIKPLVSERLGLADVAAGLERLAAGQTT